MSLTAEDLNNGQQQCSSKKKSGFQITSVTTARAHSNSAGDDTEVSFDLEDDVSMKTEELGGSCSDIFDTPAACHEMIFLPAPDEMQQRVPTEPGDQGTATVEASDSGGDCGDVEKVELAAISVEIRPEGAAPLMDVVVGGHVDQTISQSNQAYSNHQAQQQQNQQQSQSHLQPHAHAAPHGCNSRFRVVKLVEKEPFKKGRWNCTEFYEKDKEVAAAMAAASAGDLSQSRGPLHHDPFSVIARENITFSGFGPVLPPLDNQAYGHHHHQDAGPGAFQGGGESVHQMSRDSQAASCGQAQPALGPDMAQQGVLGFNQGYYEAAAPVPGQLAGNALPPSNGGSGFFEQQQQQLGLPGAPPGIGWAPDNLQTLVGSNMGSDGLLPAGQQQQPLQIPQQGYGICLPDEGPDNPQQQQIIGFHGGPLDQQMEQQHMPSFNVQMQPPQLPLQVLLPNVAEMQMRANSPQPPELLQQQQQQQQQQDQQQQQQQAWQQKNLPQPQTMDSNPLQHSLVSVVHKPASPVAFGVPVVPKSPPSAVTQQLNSVLAQMHSSQGQQQFMAQNPHLRPLGMMPQPGLDLQQLPPSFQQTVQKAGALQSLLMTVRSPPPPPLLLQQQQPQILAQPPNLAQTVPVALGFDNIMSNVQAGQYPTGASAGVDLPCVTSPLPIALAQTFNIIGFPDAMPADALAQVGGSAGQCLPGAAGGQCQSEGHQQTGMISAETSSAAAGADGAAAVALPSSGVAQGVAVVAAEDDGSSGASMVAIDNKIEQAMDLVKSHLMFAVREEVEILREQIKELVERNSLLEQENQALRNLANPDQLQELLSELPVSTPPAAAAAAAACVTGDGQNSGGGNTNGGSAPLAAAQMPQANVVGSSA